MDEAVEKNEFTCPKCGGHFYGTTFDQPGVDLRSPIEMLVGYCKGALITRDPKNGKPVYKGGYAGCTFRWSRRDDAMYGLRDHGARSGETMACVTPKESKT